jgi:hypothetical protein
MQGVDKLLETLERAAAGENIDVGYVRALRFETSDQGAEKVATESWRRLVHFAGDIDIRSKDPDYDKQMREEMEWRARQLGELLAAKR